jgi:hypothetical protein
MFERIYKARRDSADKRASVAALRHDISTFTMAFRPIQERLKQLNLEEGFLKSDRGKLLIETESTPGVTVRVYERWLDSSQGVTGAISDTKVAFGDNTSKLAIYHGSETKTRGSISGQSWTPAVSNVTQVSGSLRSKSSTVNDVEVQNVGSAYLVINGSGVNGIITFSEPHKAAAVANAITQCSERIPGFVSSREAELKQIAMERDVVEKELDEVLKSKAEILKRSESLEEAVLLRKVPEIEFLRGL